MPASHSLRAALSFAHTIGQVRQLREWKKGRMEADSILFADEQRPGASAEISRELTKMRVEMSQLKSRLAQCERCADRTLTATAKCS